MGKTKQDIEDINFILNEINKFSSMTTEDIGIHIKQPPFDMLYTINLAAGKHILIGHGAALRFNKIAKRHCELHKYNDIDVLALEREIKNEFANTFIEDKKPNEKKFIDRMLNRAVKATQNNHKTNTHYLPCVITKQGEPSEFRIGPVRFLTTDKFFKDFGAKFEKDYTSYGITGRTIITKIYDYYKSFIWVAEVTVPLCDDKVSEERALQVVQGALDVLKLCFPHSQSHDLRIGYHHSSSEDTAKITRTSDGMFHPGVDWHGYGVPTNPMWFNDIMSNNKWYLDCAGNAIESYLKPESKSENLDRWLRALYWYGQAVSDDLLGGQLVKYVAALECLTVTPSDGIEDVTDIVTRRTALLIAQAYKDDVFEKTRSNARSLYRWRSALMHGRISPIKRDIDSIVSLAHEIVPQMMLIVLNMFWCLEMNGRNSSKDLFNEYRSLERQLPIEEKKMHYYCHGSSPTTIDDTNLQLYSLEQAAHNWNELARSIDVYEKVDSIMHFSEMLVFILNCFGLSLMQLLGQNSPRKKEKVDDPKSLLHAVLNDCNVERDVKKRLGKTFCSFIEYYDAVRHFGESVSEKKYQIVDKLTLHELNKFRIMTIEIWDIIITKYKKDDKNDLKEIMSVTDLVYFQDMPYIKSIDEIIS